MKLKIISYSNQGDVEEVFNSWVEKANPDIIDIKYSSQAIEGDYIQHSVAIFYYPKKEGRNTNE